MGLNKPVVVQVKLETGHFEIVKASVGLDILLALEAVSEGVKPETGVFGPVKASLGFNILILAYRAVNYGWNRGLVTLDASRPLLALTY